LPLSGIQFPNGRKEWFKVKVPAEWREYTSHIVYPFAERFFQKRIYSSDSGDISIQIVEYLIEGKKIYEVDVQVPEQLSLLGKTVNVKVFTYKKLNFEVMENEARFVIENLTNLLKV